jgi:hypothetical protein
MTDLKFLFENLFVNKYDITYSKRVAKNTLLISAIKKDDFGKSHNYEFYFFSETVSEEYLQKYRAKEFENRILIGLNDQTGADFTEEQFLDKLSTIIDPGIYLNPNLENILKDLGHNFIPKGMNGNAAELLEAYSKECLQFLVGGKGRRYGKERSFESLPDGAILGNGINVLFDAKAYKGGFNPSADDLKRFQSYINDFNKKYSHFSEKIFSFIVVSGHFQVGEDALIGRSRELYEMCQTTLSFISSENLAVIIKISRDHAEFMSAINWKKILSHTIPNGNLLLHQIEKIKKDKIV